MHRTEIVSLLLLAVLALPASAEMSKQERKEAKNMLDGTLYLRIDAPCATGRHPYGTYKRPLVEVTSEGVNTEGDNVFTASWWHADSTYWGISINDPVKLDEADFDEDEVELELEGTGDAEDNATVIKFVGIESLDDFKAAFDRTFATRPLQELHDDWPAEIKQAIAKRELQTGMTKKQAYYVTGTPERFEKKDDGGKEVEIWSLRQDKGMKMGFFMAKAGESTGLPTEIRFEDGVLVDVGGTSGDSSSFSVDD